MRSILILPYHSDGVDDDQLVMIREADGSTNESQIEENSQTESNIVLQRDQRIRKKPTYLSDYVLDRAEIKNQTEVPRSVADIKEEMMNISGWRRYIRNMKHYKNIKYMR